MLSGLRWGPMPESAWRRSIVFTALTLLLASALSLVSSSTARAFQDVDADPAEPPAEAATAPAASEGQSESEETDGAVTESFLTWAVRASGIFGFLILLCSFIMVALIMMNILALRREQVMPAAFIESFEQKLNGKDYQGAYETARNDGSLLGRVLAAGMSRLNRGYEDAVEGMQEVGEDENMVLEHRLSYLALIATVTPMLGLLGTVQGMIMSFSEIANSVQQPKPKDLAEGISTALFTTLEGLIVAIPAIVAYSILRNRLSRFMLEVGIISENLMGRFSTVGKKTAGGAAPATAPAARVAE